MKRQKKEYDLQRHEDDLRNMGPVDARIYLEEMSWNEGWNYFFLLITIRKNVRDFV